MFIFIVLLILLFVVSRVGLKKRGLWIWTFILAFILGFRGSSVGDDTERYIKYYYGTDFALGVGYMEPGWTYISTYFRNIGFSAYFFHFLIALVTLSCFTYVISKEDDKKVRGQALFFLYTLGFYLYMFNGMRQFLAIGICFVAFYVITKGKNILGILLILFSSLFHTSALVALSFVFVKRLKLTIVNSIMMFIASLVMGVFILRGVMSVLAGGYAHIIDEHGFRTSMSFVFFVCITTCVLFLWLIDKKPMLKDNIWMKLFFVSIIVQNVLCQVVYGPRIVFYFSTAQIIALAIVYKETKDSLVRMVIYLYAFVTFFRYLIPELYRKDESLLPYYMTFQIFG